MKRLLSALILPVLAFATIQLPAFGQDEEPVNSADSEPVSPVISINIASIEKLRSNVDFIFELIGRNEMTDLINSQLANVRDLKGIDQKRPMGMMIFLQQGFIPTPIPVGYVPVEDIGELTQTVGTMRAELKPVAGEENAYEFIPRRGGTQAGIIQHDYLFITRSVENLDQNFVDPAAFSRKLSDRYDIAVSANLSTTPKPVKSLLLNTVKAALQTQMQQRDEEPDGPYRIRRANAESQLHMIENILKEGEELTFGIKVDQETQQAYLEFVVRAASDSRLADEMEGGIGKPSYFRGAIDETVPLSASMSLLMNETDRTTLTELFGFVTGEASRDLAGLPRDTLPEDVPELQSAKDFFGSLTKTAEEGLLDGFVQFLWADPDDSESRQFVLVGGAKLKDAEFFGSGLQDMLRRLKERENTPIDIAMETHGNAIFHRIDPGPTADGQELYGQDFKIYIATDAQAVWFAVGGDRAVPSLKSTMDKVKNEIENPTRGKNLAPFQFIMNGNHWLRFGASNGVFPERFGEMAGEAFKQEGSDVLRIESRPVQNGFRFRLQVESGFLRLLGGAIAQRVDRRQAL